jgi:hypothetical protein
VVTFFGQLSWGAGPGPGGCRVYLAPGAFAPGVARGAALFVSEKEYFAEYRAYFEGRGCLVRLGELPPDGTIEERALVFRDQIERFVAEAGPGVWLVAHSQAGLDLRFALKTLRLRGVDAVAFIGTPHRGTPLADWVVGHRQRESWLYWVLRWFAFYDLRELRFAGELSADFLTLHASRFEAVEGVRYASARALCLSGCSWAIRVLRSVAGVPPGDGLVPVESQGFGEELGTYDLDHLSEIAVDARKRPERAKLLERIWRFFEASPPSLPSKSAGSRDKNAMGVKK